MPEQLNEDVKLQVLHEHYKDSFRYVRKDISARTKIFSIILIFIALHFFQVTDPEKASNAADAFLKSTVGFTVSIKGQAIGALLWFVLLSAIVRYYQINIYINRQYKYLHKLEKIFKELLGKEMIFREGNHYLSDYPNFSKGIHILYTWVFPLLILVMGLLKIYTDYPGEFNLPYSFSLICFLATIIFTLLYLGFLHCKSIKKKESHI
ncbi:MAG: hypothetical protein OXB84_08075 [Halobacteriovoraceae bacterium]|nr:hypothetical protein [Halobacteriovoraceae bacterium]